LNRPQSSRRLRLPGQPAHRRVDGHRRLAVPKAEDAKLFLRRAADRFDVTKPQSEFRSWLVDEVALIRPRIDRCAPMERRARELEAMRAEPCWVDDRRLDAVRLGGLLPRWSGSIGGPSGLRMADDATGRCWAPRRDVNGARAPDQTRRAFELNGTPIEFREGSRPGASLDLEGRMIESADDPVAVARREIAALKERRDLIEGLDEVNQAPPWLA
jgi:hypothetical protein